ncbi:LysR family transcriptional regulator [Streptomyces sp. CAU 1734]|uniref:LysR family transcriptional regulator n=1 Tax=Streptomyces sp. CAU 1734 TaxID=3140360 RepID=UPI00326064B4
MEFRQLVTFRQVAKDLSFTRAAVELNYAQSSVTSQIRALEASLHTELFDRLGGRIKLTEAGRRLVPYAERIIELAEEARTAVPGIGAGASGTLTIGTMESITSYRLPPLLEFFHHRYPGIRLRLRPGGCAETCRELRRGSCDIGFLTEAATEHEGVHTEVLSRESLVLVAAPEHPMAGVREITLGGLREATVLAAEPGCSYRDLFEDVLRTASGEPVTFLEFGTVEAIKRGAIGGLGVSLLPRVAVADELASGRLAALPWDPPFAVYTQLAWRRGKRVSPEMRLFIDETMRLIGEEQQLSRPA